MFGSEAEGVAQEVWLWLLRLGTPSAKIDTPWLEAVVRHFVLRRRREAARRWHRERRWAESMTQRCEPDRDRSLDGAALLRRMEEALAGKDRRVLDLIRLGFTFAEATAALGIPRGSRDRVYRRLVSCGRNLSAA